MFRIVNLHVALWALPRHRVQTALTLLGIALGVAVVLTMVALGTGARASIEAQVRSAGANLVTVTAGNYRLGANEAGDPADHGTSVLMMPRQVLPAGRTGPGRGGSTRLTADDAAAIATEIEGVDDAAPMLREWTSVDGDGRRWVGVVRATDASLARVDGLEIRRGRFLRGDDVRRSSAVAAVGQAAALELFGAGVNPVGRALQIRGRAFTVVGIVAKPAWAGSDRRGDRPEATVYVPVTTLQGIRGIRHLDALFVSASVAGEATRVAADIAMLLRARHAIAFDEPDDFVVRTQAATAVASGGLHPALARALSANVYGFDQMTLEEMSGTLRRASGTLTALLLGCASVSLVVGGIGIMNLMLISVTERTREIGLRRAVGATPRDVLWQFLLEAVALSWAGGVAGVLLGIVGAILVEMVFDWTAVVSPGAVALALIMAAVTGVGFGVYPARSAARLDPIQALRRE